MVDKLFSRAATLPIQTTTDSKPIDFVHAAGADVLEEATAFCETHVPQVTVTNKRVCPRSFRFPPPPFSSRAEVLTLPPTT